MGHFARQLSAQEIKQGYALLNLMEHLDREMDLLNQQRRLEELTVNNKRLEEELIETEKLVLLWERKIQLAK